MLYIFEKLKTKRRDFPVDAYVSFMCMFELIHQIFLFVKNYVIIIKEVKM